MSSCQTPLKTGGMEELLLPSGEEEARSEHSSCAPGAADRSMGERLRSFVQVTVKGDLRRTVLDFCKRNGLLTLSVIAVLTGCTLGFMLRGTQLSTQVGRLTWRPHAKDTWTSMLFSFCSASTLCSVLILLLNLHISSLNFPSTLQFICFHKLPVDFHNIVHLKFPSHFSVFLFSYFLFTLILYQMLTLNRFELTNL